MIHRTECNVLGAWATGGARPVRGARPLAPRRRGARPVRRAVASASATLPRSPEMCSKNNWTSFSLSFRFFRIFTQTRARREKNSRRAEEKTSRRNREFHEGHRLPFLGRILLSKTKSNTPFGCEERKTNRELIAITEHNKCGMQFRKLQNCERKSKGK